jgi:hypothetical protein
MSEAVYSKGVTNALIRRPHILKRLRTRTCATFSTDPLIPQDLRGRIGPILINADSRRLKRQVTVESPGARGNRKSEVRNRKSEIRRRECGQARRGGQALARLAGAYMEHDNTFVTARQDVYHSVFEHGVASSARRKRFKEEKDPTLTRQRVGHPPDLSILRPRGNPFEHALQWGITN